MSKSLIYMVNSNTQSVANGGTVNFGNIVRRYGCNCQSNGNTPVVNGTGYYDIDTNITLTGAAGTVVLALYKDGVAIPGTSQSATLTANSVTAFNISAPVRIKCCCDSTIALVISGVATEVSNAAIEVKKD